MKCLLDYLIILISVVRNMTKEITDKIKHRIKKLLKYVRHKVNRAYIVLVTEK